MLGTSWADGNATPLSAARINRPLALLRPLLRLAHEEWGLLAEVPRIKLEREPEGEPPGALQDPRAG
ncbi:MAG: hypothetical protein ACRDHF_07925 [Tepidiformaceae bacterium]